MLWDTADEKKALDPPFRGTADQSIHFSPAIFIGRTAGFRIRICPDPLPHYT